MLRGTKPPNTVPAGAPRPGVPSRPLAQLHAGLPPPVGTPPPCPLLREALPGYPPLLHSTLPLHLGISSFPPEGWETVSACGLLGSKQEQLARAGKVTEGKKGHSRTLNTTQLGKPAGGRCAQQHGRTHSMALSGKSEAADRTHGRKPFI